MYRTPITNMGVAGENATHQNAVANEQLLQGVSTPTTVGGGLQLGNFQTHVSAGLPLLFILVLGLGLAYMLFRGKLGLSASLSGRVGD